VLRAMTVFIPAGKEDRLGSGFSVADRASTTVIRGDTI